VALCVSRERSAAHVRFFSSRGTHHRRKQGAQESFEVLKLAYPSVILMCTEEFAGRAMVASAYANVVPESFHRGAGKQPSDWTQPPVYVDAVLSGGTPLYVLSNMRSVVPVAPRPSWILHVCGGHHPGDCTSTGLMVAS
jgi:hypothetical protein